MQFLKQAILSRVKNARVYLFGSRVDDNKKGGDIDILILSEQKLSLKDKTHIRYSFYEKYGEQKLDLVNYRFEETSNFKDLALLEAEEI
ncbi:MAG TPA: nucleotidyltransferase domain-containing protein [Candidatus Deferrimicrobium sp.]|nr:nucleotidyltransferase domain-containing protein [Candidatus Deferrimicrobium sp.]